MGEVEILTKRYVSPIKLDAGNALDTRRVFWIIAGGPGAAQKEVEQTILLGYLKRFAAQNSAVYLVGHRGTAGSSGLPSERTLGRTIARLPHLLHGCAEQLPGMTPAEATSDYVAIMKAVMDEDLETVHFIHGFSYGGYLALHIASQLSQETQYQRRLDGLVIDSGLPASFNMNRDLKSNQTFIQELMANCKRDFFCSQFTDFSVLLDAFHAVQEGRSVCATAMQKILLANQPSRPTQDSLRALVKSLADIEIEAIPSHKPSADTQEAPPTIVDGRVLAVQLLTHISLCSDPPRLADLLLRMQDLLEIPGVEDVLESLGGTRPACAKEPTATDPPAVKHPEPLYLSQKISSRNSDFNFLLHLNIIFGQFWDHEYSQKEDQKNRLFPPFLPVLEKASKLVPNYGERTTMSSLTLDVPVLLMFGVLDSKLGIETASRLYDSIPTHTDKKRLLLYTNRSNMVLRNLPHELAGCPALALQAFFFGVEYSDYCRILDNSRTLDWQQEELGIPGLHYWDTSRASFPYRILFALLKVYNGWPLWTVTLSMLVSMLVFFAVWISIKIIWYKSSEKDLEEEEVVFPLEIN